MEPKAAGTSSYKLAAVFKRYGDNRGAETCSGSFRREKVAARMAVLAIETGFDDNTTPVDSLFLIGIFTNEPTGNSVAL